MQEGKVARPDLWYVIEGCLEFLAGDYYSAEKTFTAASEHTRDKLLKEQLEAFRLALKIANLKKPDEETENFASALLKDNKVYKQFESFPDYLRDRMSYLYKEAKQDGKAFLCANSFTAFKVNPQPELADDMLAFSLKMEKTFFERMLLQKATANDILDIKATALLGRGELEAAFETFKRIPATSWDDYGQFDPFKETFKDCIRCYQRRDTSLITSLNKGELMEQLLDLEYKAKGDMEGSARHYYKLGLAYYNMSYFGYEWKALDYFRSGSTYPRMHLNKSNVYVHSQYPLGNREYTDISKAYTYFEKAHLLAKEPELAARAAFQAARCDQKIYFMSTQYKPELCCNRFPKLPAEYLTNFKRLKEQYQETNFHKQIIQECKYFAAYSRR